MIRQRLENAINLYKLENVYTKLDPCLSIVSCSSGVFPTDCEVTALAKSMDEDGSGRIELQELIKNLEIQVKRRRHVLIPRTFPDSTDEEPGC